MQKIENLIQNLKELIKNKYQRIVVRGTLRFSWVWFWFPSILYLIFGVEERPTLFEDPFTFLFYRVLSVFLTKTIIDKWLVPKILPLLSIIGEKLSENPYLILYLIPYIKYIIIIIFYFFLYKVPSDYLK